MGAAVGIGTRRQDGRGSHSGSVGYMEDGSRQAGTPGYKGTRAWVGGSPCWWVGPFLCWVGGCALGELRMGRIYRDGYMSVSVRICPISLESLY
jgi:hypothetical protein